MVERIYELAGQPMTDGARAAMAGVHRRATPAASSAASVYDLADFGLDPAERRRALRFYTDRFGVPEES